MKVQLIKEVNDRGETWYCIEKDGRYIPSTMTRKFEEAVETYNRVISADPSREVIMETEIDY
jgi:hypothetical protein